MTRQEWELVDRALSGLWGTARLRVDGREVWLDRALTGKNRLGIVVYVDGVIKTAWCGPPKEIPEQKYLYPQRRYKYRRKYRRILRKMSRKRRRELGVGDPDERWTCYLPVFPSVRAVRWHYGRTFESIELLEA